MKKFRKLVPALCMLLVSAVLMGTSTYAWFSMNKTVTAGDMSITATADNPFLQIMENGASGDFKTSATLIPPTGDNKFSLVTAVIGEDKKSVTWKTGYSNDPSSSTAAGDLTALTLTGTASASGATVLAADGKNYVLEQDLVVKVVANSTNGTNLKVAEVTFTTGTNSIAASGRLLILSTEGYQLFKMTNGKVTAAEEGSSDALLGSMTAGTTYTLKCYFYFDGEDDSAYTNKATNLSAVTASIKLTID